MSRGVNVRTLPRLRFGGELARASAVSAASGIAAIVASEAGIALAEGVDGGPAPTTRSLRSFSPGRVYFREDKGAVYGGVEVSRRPTVELALKGALETRSVAIEIAGQTGSAVGSSTFDDYGVER